MNLIKETGKAIHVNLIFILNPSFLESGLANTSTNDSEALSMTHQGACFTDPYSGVIDDLVGRLELLILETKARHDEFHKKMLKISEQLLSMIVKTQEQQAKLFVL